jgi:hypothetical protein
VKARAAVAEVGRWIALRWVALDLDLRDAEFYGGLLLIGFAAGRLPIVGAVLVLHAWLAPLLAARRS